MKRDNEIIIYQDENVNTINSYILKFGEVAAANSQLTALVDRSGKRRISYAELDRMRLAVASKLLSMGLEPGAPVIINMGRCREYVAAWLGVMTAGCATVPLEPGYPESRVDFIRKDCGATVVIDEAFMEELPAADKNAVRIVPGNTPAHIVYTSGSTGRPKGVIHTVDSIYRMACGNSFLVDIGERPVFATCDSFTFIISVYETLAPLGLGGEVHIMDEIVRKDVTMQSDYYIKHNINIGHVTPQLLKSFHCKSKRLKRVLTGGELVSGVYCPDYEIVVLYGSSEMGIICSFKIDKPYRSTPVGKPFEGCNVEIVDEELCVEAVMAVGYMNLPEKSAEVFERLPDGRVRYHSGDVVKMTPEGNYVYVNRKDWMVKINGQRVESFEVENVMKEIEGIGNAAVKAFRDDDGQNYICGYYTQAVGKSLPSESEIHRAMAKLLPGYMIPRFLVAMEKLPLNERGKIDRKALMPPSADNYKRAYKAPSNDRECAVCAAMESVLHCGTVGADDDFFALGGDSIKVLKLSAAIKEMTGLKLSSNDVFTARTVASIAASLKVDDAPAVPVTKIAPVPLALSQIGVYFDSLERPESTMYNMPFALRLPEGIDIERFIAAVEKVAAMHPALAATVAVEGETPMMRPGTEQIKVKRRKAENARDGFVRPFDLEKGPLCRFEVIEGNPSEFLLDVHHIVFDGTSMKLFLQQISEVYDGKDVAAEDMTFFDYAAWETNIRETEEYRRAEEFFDSRLAGVEFDAALVPDVAGTGKSAGSFVVAAPDGLRPDVVEHFARRLGVTENSLFLSAFSYALASFAGASECCFTTVDDGRHDERMSQTVGMFVKMLPLHIVTEGRDVESYLRYVRDEMFGTMSNDCISFGDLGSKYGANLNVSFVYQSELLSEVNIGGVSVLPENLPANEYLSDLIFMMLKTAGGYRVVMQYNKSVYSEQLMRSLVRTVFTVAEGLMTCKRLEDITLVDEKSRAFIDEFNNTECPELPYRTVNEKAEPIIRSNQDKDAVVFKDRRYSYADFERLTRNLAGAIHNKGIGKEDFVAILVPRDEYMAIGAWGVIRSGAAFQPLDPTYPKERLEYMVSDSGARLLIADRGLRAIIGSYGGDVLYTDEIASLPDTALPNGPAPEDAFTVIYTSGTTGKPKGCVLENRNIAAFCRNHCGIMGIGPDSLVATYASFGFDAGVMDTVNTIYAGATLCIIPDEIRLDIQALDDFFCTNRITHGFMTTQVGRMFAQMTRCSTLESFLMGGEKLVPFTPTGRFKVINGYGPCETMCYVCSHVIKDDCSIQPIGKPMPDTKLYVVDKNGRLMPAGAVGELCISGRQVGRGYIGLPEKTAEVFVQNPFDGRWREYGRMYRTGDMVRLLPEGELEYIGRHDGQVKLRGFRIEMSEIESAMSKFPGIVSAVAEVKSINGVQHLCAYYVSDTGIDEAALKSELSKSLASYMIPDVFVRLAKLPMTSNGKVDRKALPVPEIQSAAYVAPEGAAETAVAEVMADVLNLSSPVGRDDDFLSLGGDSIKSIRLVSKLRAAGVAVSVSDIMKAKTVKGIAAAAKYVTTFAADQCDWSGEVPLTPVQTLFLHEWKMSRPGHFNQSQMLTASERIDADILKASLDALARHHDMLRAVYAGDVFDKLITSTQRVRAAEGEGPLCELAVIKGDDKGLVERNAELVQASFNLAGGPLFKAILFKGDKSDYILLVIHHLVIDGVSWQILIEDLETAYGQLKTGKNVSLPAKTMSFRDWSAAIGRYATGYSLKRESDYWRDIDAKIAAMPHTTIRSTHTQEIVRALDPGTFAALRGKASAAYHTEINDLLLTALGRAYSDISGEGALSVELEGHGREPLDEETQIDRTVGWFTSVYPVIVKTTEDLRLSIRGVKEMLRRVPNHGLGYGILRHISKENFGGPEPVPAVSFNYLGSFNEGGGKGLFAVDSSLPQGHAISPDNVFGAAMAVNCWGTSDGTFQIAFTYDSEVWEENRAAAFADSFVGELEAVTAHTLAVKLPEWTASDLGETVWPDSEFLTVVKDFAARGEILERIYPLMPMQEGMLLEALSAPESYTYNVASRFSLDILPEKEALERALERLLVKPEVLRTAIIHDGVCEPRQAIVSGRKLPLAFVDLSDTQDTEAEAAALARREFERPIDLQRDPLFRIVCIKTSASSCQLLFVIHHIVADGWCKAIYLGDLMKFLREEIDRKSNPDDFSYKKGRYEKYVRGILARDRSAALAYWRNLLDGYEAKAEIPAYERVIDVNRAASNELTLNLPQDITKQLEKVCRAAGCTVNNAVEAAWGLILQKYNRTDDAVFVKVVSGRDHTDENVSDVVGLFINSVPVRVRTEKDATLLDLVKSQQRQAGETSANDWVPLADIQRETTLGSNLFQSILAFENYETSDETDSPLGLRMLSWHETNVSEIAIAAYVSGDRLAINLKFDTSKYTSAGMQRLMDSLRHILCAIARTPDSKAGETPLLDDEGAAELIVLGRGPSLDYDRSETFIDMFLHQVKANPDAKAVVGSNGTFTYGELDAQSDALASRLIGCGVTPGDFVAVKLGRVKEFPLAVIAIWKAGAAYVPIDPEYPEERIAYMLEDSGAKVVIDENFLVTTQLNCVVTNLAEPSGVAYMIYTSGSTGKPKGAMVTHANLRCFIQWLGRMVNIRPGDQIGEFVSFSFDGSTADLYPSLAGGATLHIFSSQLRHDLDGMRRYIAENRIRGMVLITSMAVELLADGEITLDYLLVGGERVVPFRPISTLNFYNVYGPTEFTNMAVTGLVDQTFPDDSIPIGRPVPGTLCAVVDPAGNLLPRGMVGELVLAGEQLSRGYWHRPELTAEKFVKLPWLEQRAYRTGDLARWREDGRLTYCGRIDNQVKLRGFRIEMGEIESAMLKFPGIASAVAEVMNINGAQHLCGYYVSDTGIDESALKSELSRSLTEYMVPDVFVRLEKLPLTSAGKIDRKALPAPLIKAGEIVAPETEQEKALFEVVAAELKTREFGVTTNLISMGLTSLRAIRLSAAIRKATRLVVTTGEILAKPHIHDWAAFKETQVETIAVAPPQEAYPLTANQTGIYLDWEHNRTGLQYNVPSALRIVGINASELRDAVVKAVAAHPYFKVHFELRNGTPVQVRRDDAPLEVSFTKLDHEPDAAFFQARVRPFDLLGDNLARFEIYESPEATYLFTDIHHIIYDGGSANIFVSAIKAALMGEEPATEAVSAYDYALHDAAWQASEAFAKAETWFDGLVAGSESFLYPSVRNGVAASGKVAYITRRVPFSSIKAKCNELGITENAFFATAFCETLRRMSRTSEIQIATVSSGRSLEQLSNTVGMFVQTLPLVIHKAEGSVAETIRAMQSQIAGTISNDRYPYTKLVERFGIKPQVLYAYQGDVIDSGENPDISSVPLALDTAKVPLALNVVSTDGNYELVFEYDSGLYGQEEIEVLAKVLCCLAVSMSGLDADAPLSRATLIDSKAADDLLTLGNGGTVDYNRSETFIDIFLKNVSATPNATAVVDCDSSLTYFELDTASDALAAKLVCDGVDPGDFIAVKMPRVKEFLVAVLGIWKAGAAYVPIDPEYPEERINYMIEDSGAKVVIDVAYCGNIAADGKVNGKTPPSINHSLPESPAYMIYTSGSTGKPKGVVVSHSNLMALNAWLVPLLGLTGGDSVAEYASFSFDGSCLDIYPSIAAGCALHILSEEVRRNIPALVSYLSEHYIKGMFLPTKFAQAVLDSNDLPLEYLIMGGEKNSGVRKTATTIFEMYGPTEFTVASSFHRVNQEVDIDRIPIGRPVPNSVSLIVDAYGNLVPRGTVGELVLAGEQLSQGYRNRPELTAEKFVKLPLPEQRAYRTGDLARWNGDGELEYMGRIDNQVKLRGFRIEMGEIESTMSKFPGVAVAVADVKEVNGLQRLVGYYVTQEQDSGHTLNETLFKSFLAATLTDYMIPEVLICLEKLPMTTNGKVDRKSLPIPDVNVLGGKYVEPATDEERTLCEAYGRILGLSKYGAETDFFRVGGSSLVGVRLVVELQRLGLKVVYGDLFKYKTPRLLAAFLTGSSKTSSGSQSSTFSAGSYDYTAIDALLARTPDEPCDGTAVNKLNNVLLTGATGYLGIHILKQLLETTGCNVTILARSKDGMTPQERVTIQYYYYFEQELPEPAKGRISFVEADITEDNLTVKLADVRFDTLFNCAALVKHYVADDILDRVNVEGVRNLIEVCAAHDARLIQISTYSIGGVAAPRTILDERHLYIGQTSDNEYVRTKYEAERLVLEAIAAGRIRGKVMRLGNLMGRETDGVFQMNFHSNAFINSVRTFSRLGAFPLANAAVQVEFSQIDYVAEAVVRLSATMDSMVVFHPFNHYRQDLGSVIDATNSIGKKIEFVSKAEFTMLIETMRGDSARAEDLQGLLHYGQRVSENNFPVQTSNDWTTNVLRHLGFLWKMPDAGYLEKFFGFLDGLGFFD